VTDIYGGDAPLTVMLPAGLMRQLAVAAAHDLRAPEAEALWLIRDGLARLDARRAPRPRRVTLEDRLEAATPLFAELAAAYAEAGRPSTRQVTAAAREARHSISHTTVHDILIRKRVPSWAVTEAFAAGLGISPGRFKAAWAQAWEPLHD
jgi:hypothetical protein